MRLTAWYGYPAVGHLPVCDKAKAVSTPTAPAHSTIADKSPQQSWCALGPTQQQYETGGTLFGDVPGMLRVQAKE